MHVDIGLAYHSPLLEKFSRKGDSRSRLAFLLLCVRVAHACSAHARLEAVRFKVSALDTPTDSRWVSPHRHTSSSTVSIG